MNRHDLQKLAEAYTNVHEKKDSSYLETDMKKRQENNEKARKDMAKVKGQKNPHFEEVETVAEDDKSYDRNRKRAAQRAADRNAARAAGKTGVVPGVGYVTARKEKESYTDSKGVERHKSGAKNEEYELELDENRRAARAAGGYKDDSKKQNDPSKAGFTGIGNMSIDQIRKMSARMDKEKKESYDPMDDPDFDHDEAEKNRGVSGKNNPKGGKAVGKKKKMKEETVAEDAKMAKQSDEKLSALHKQVTSSDQSLPSNQFMLKRVQKEMNRRKKVTKEELEGNPVYEATKGDIQEFVGAMLGNAAKSVAQGAVNSAGAALATPVGAAIAGGTVGAVTGDKKKVKKSLATGAGAAAGAALGGLPGAVIGGVAGNALS